MKVGLIGCGFVSYCYGGTLSNHGELEVGGVYDSVPERMGHWTSRFGGIAHPTLHDLLSSDVSLIVNLSNPAAHFEVTRACLQHGKHVYSEKPLASSIDQARALVDLAQQQGLHIACAPCSILGEAAQTLWRAIDERVVGRIHTVYASLSEPWPSERAVALLSESFLKKGANRETYTRMWSAAVDWPIRDEFDVGCAYEHVAYPIKWLTTWFGPVREIVNFSSSRRPSKSYFAPKAGELLSHRTTTPDLYVSCLSLDDDVEVVMLNSWVTPDDHRLILCGDDGHLELENQWDYGARVWVHRGPAVRYEYPPFRRARFKRGYSSGYPPNMDYARGVAALAEGVRRGEASKHLAALDQELHVQEVTDVVARGGKGVFDMKTAFTSRPERLPNASVVRIAFVGTGDVAKKYLVDLSPTPGWELAGMLSHSGDSSRARALLALTNRTGRVYDSLDEVLADERVDVVVNLTLPEHHAEITKRAIKGGKHVFSEKPLALRLSDAEEIESLAEQHRVRVACAPGTYLSRQQLAVGELVRSGRIGEVTRVRAVLNHGCLELWHPNPEPLYALGMHIDVGIYPIALTTRTFGRVWKVRASGESVTQLRQAPGGKEFRPSTPDRVRMEMTLGSGLTLDIESNSYELDRKWYVRNPSYVEFEGARGALRLSPPFASEAHLSYSGDAADLADLDASTRSPPRPQFHFALGLNDLVRSILSGTRHQCCVQHAVHIAAVIEATSRALSSGKEVLLRGAATRPAWM